MKDNTEKRRINFYGDDVAKQIDSAIKLATIRVAHDKYRGHGVGETVIADCEGEEIEVIIWGKLEVPLNIVHQILLNLDGYIDGVEQAKEDLGKYYAEFTSRHSIIFIGIIAKGIFDKLQPEQKELLLSQSEGTSLKAIVSSILLEDIFEQSLLYWQNNQDKL